MKRSSWFWIVPVLATILAALTIGWSQMEKTHVSEDLENIFEEHVQSVTRLIKEGVREATSAINLVYQVTEKDLSTCVDLIGNTKSLDPELQEQFQDAGLYVWVTRASTTGAFDGVWGPVVGEDRKLLMREVMQSEPGEIRDAGAAFRLGLYCAHFQKSWGNVVVCKSAEELSRLRAETGLGPLLRHVTLDHHPVVYAAIQDQTGVLAGSPGARLSSWQSDPELARARNTQIDSITFRLRPGSEIERHLFEGLSPFSLPDGSTALLRVGIDATHLFEIRKEIFHRHNLFVVVTTLLGLLAWLGAWLWNLWDRRHQDVKQRLAAREELHRHWQAIGQMAATVAHEVRNPLNTLIMTAQRLEREFEVPDSEREEFNQLVRNIHGQTERVDRVVGEFLELGRPLILNPEKVSWPDQLEEVLGPLRFRAQQEGKHLKSRCHGERLVFLDPLRFGQIVTNLTANALDAVGSEGTVQVLGHDGEDGLYLVIEDDGPGMNEDTLLKAEQAFFTTKAKGTGLGLPLARRLIEAHNGTMQLASLPEKGTRVELFLPTKAAQGKREKMP